jgi:hypothetical protein
LGISDNLFCNKELLVGKLYIEVCSYSFSDRNFIKEESDIVESFKKLKEEQEEYKKAYTHVAESLSELERIRREELKSCWNEVERNIPLFRRRIIDDKKKGNEDNEDNEDKSLYEFDVVLSRDGILFLRDATCDEFKVDYFRSGEASDYTQNIPVYRLFKMALHFMSTLFHKNYHHYEEDDSFLPATNLHPIRRDTNLDRLVKHQIEAFLTPVIKVKRNIDNPRTVMLRDPLGILTYAKAFLQVLENNGFIDNAKTRNYMSFIEYQNKEFEIVSANKKTKLNFFLAQDNWIARLTLSFAVTVAIIQIFRFLFIESPCIIEIHDPQILKVILISLSFGGAWLLHNIYINRQIYKMIVRKEKKKKTFLYKDSSDKGISLKYAFFLWWINIKARIGSMGINIFGFCLFMILTIVAVAILVAIGVDDIYNFFKELLLF